MNLYEVTYRHKDQETVNTRRVMGWSAEEAGEWLRDTLWTIGNGREEIEILRVENAR